MLFEQHRTQLANNSSTQETLIYRNATAAHLDALAAHIDMVSAKALDDYPDVLNNNNNDDDFDGDYFAARRKYYETINSHGTYPGPITFFGNDSGLLFFKMSSIVGNTAQGFLHFQVISWAIKMGLQLNYWQKNVTHKQEDQQKQVELSIQPMWLRGTVNHFPTMVIEQGNSQVSLRREKD